MKLFRSILFWCHLIAGVFAGVVIFVMSVTGVLLTYERQIMEWADTRTYDATPPTPSARRLPVETLLARVRNARPDVAPATLTVRADPAAPAALSLGRDGAIYVNTYTGAVLGEGSPGVRRFFGLVTDWHRWLGASDEHRPAGRAITAACNLAFLFLVISGPYLWWPRKWTWRQLRNVTWFRGGLPGKARDFNWHNVIGFWCAIPLFIVVLSAVVISYPWASNLVYRVVGEEPPSRSGPPRAGRGGAPRGGGRAPSGGGTIASLEVDRLNSLWTRAERQVSDWRSIALRLPTSPRDPVSFTIDRGTGGQPQERAQLTLDRNTGEVVAWEPFSSQTRGRRLRSWLRFAHTGEALGLMGQTLAGIVSAGSALLVWTGLALAWRRFFVRKRPAERPTAERTTTAA
ncbi:MAG: PepSY domain-containing protein [Luteitalea sp.]|nr:PepSY domain-containing protein [Luteitalea sp.]